VKPLGLPTGSVRAVLALGLTAAAIALAFIGALDPGKVYDLAILAVGFYFVTRPRPAD